jgi:peptidoglycan hydrolase-like protein with peptidoglycan-binding domain
VAKGKQGDFMLVKDLQTHLKAKGFYQGKIDGIYGPISATASLAYLTDNISAAAKHSPDSMNAVRVRVAAMQLVVNQLGIEVGEIDGYLGPQTKYAFSVFAKRNRGEEDETWRDYEAPRSDWPTQREVPAYYGDRGKSQVRIQVPYPHIIAWNPKQVLTSFFCHEKVHDSLSRVLMSVRKEYGIQRIDQLGLNLFGGCLNVRKMRGGNSWSMHSWGIALDYHPAKNAFRWGRDKALFAKPAYNDWWDIWESEGWTSLGRQRNFDWMHVQAATIK